MKGTVILLCIAVAALGIAQLITNRQINELKELCINNTKHNLVIGDAYLANSEYKKAVSEHTKAMSEHNKAMGKAIIRLFELHCPEELEKAKKELGIFDEDLGIEASDEQNKK